MISLLTIFAIGIVVSFLGFVPIFRAPGNLGGVGGIVMIFSGIVIAAYAMYMSAATRVPLFGF
jgi:hypothetical protein